MSVSVRYLDRNLLKNVLHHVDTHNRLMEEKEMWTHKRKRRRDESSSEEEEDRSSRGRKSYGRMRSDSVKDSRAIVKQKAADGKWSHSGFMELYPDDFLDKQSMDEMSGSDEEGREKKKKKKKHKRESSGDGSHPHRTPGSREDHATFKQDQDDDRRSRFNRSKSPRRHKHSEYSKRLPNTTRNENNSSATGKNNRHRTMDGKRGRDRDQRSNEIVSPKRHELSNRTGRYPAKDPGVNSSHDNKEPRGRYRRSPRKHEHSRGMKSSSDGGLMKGVGQNEKGTGLGSPGKQKHSGNEEMVPEGRSPRKHQHSRGMKSPSYVGLRKGVGQNEKGSGLGYPGKQKPSGNEEMVPEGRSPRKHQYSRGMKSPSDGGLRKGVGQNEKGTGLGSPGKQKHSGNEEMVPEGRSPRKHELSRSIEGPVDVSVVKGSSQTEERVDLGSPWKVKHPGSEARVPEERFSDLEDEVFGLSLIRAKLQKREREMRRRMEKRIERYGVKEGGRHRKKHKKKKSKKKKKEGDVER